ncbi:heparan-alpha-glucosaminide N-acetyltransferase isoform X2 [Harpegnathos saltator]|uniref:Heparan-alpha-glucosaminide N-acetyltransferase n=1 Tax=Harpegnathos saltator TaxID=610380 RepID=E2BSR6_HARSA|nr:heparan-alpha-glucosaminide N-acetyltransferase isoform X2 [Harpegnathos saltator]EFN81312.1 Heparan-alpha-glucosaminide N-acetyltransferase [Harpegnathos saltator]
MSTMREFDCLDHKVTFDEACVNVISDNSNYDSLWLYSLSSDCVSCPYKRLMSIPSIVDSSLKFSTVKAVKWRVLDNDGKNEYISAENTNDIFCELSPNMGQYGLYELAIQDKACSFRTLKNPTYPYTELFVISAIIVLILLGISAGRFLWRTYRRRYGKGGKEEATNKEPTKRRVKAIDAFRGASTLFMIFVNDGSGSYSVLGHTTWNGMLPGDLVFPCFMWIMGVCVPIALSAQLRRGIPKLEIAFTVLKRSFLLFLIGVSLNTLGTNAQLEKIRVFGVLQRFGVTYLVVSVMYLCLEPSLQLQDQDSSRNRVTRVLRDMQVLLPYWSFMLILVMVHCGLTFGLAVPNCPTGYLGPGGTHEDGYYMNCTGGAAGYIDRVVLTINHIFAGPTIASVYGSGPFDPEGILGCLTATFQVYLGVHAGVILMMYKNWKERVVRWLSWAVLYGVLGCILHFCNVIPVNKNLWSLSFVFVSTSFALAFLSGCYLLIDVVRVWQGGPFRIAGMNALVLYVGHMMCYQIFPFHWRIGEMDSRALCFIESIWVVVLWTIIAYIMHHKRTYITL